MTNMKNSAGPKRILAIDILRGITIAGMILVNNPGSWGHIFKPLEHAEWIGLTPTDLVFPFFMFIMGMTTYISLRKYNFKPTADAIRKIVVRTIVIMLIGSFIGMFVHFCSYWGNADENLSFGSQLLEALNAFPTLRMTGVLHRLAVCYCIVSILALLMNHKRFPLIIALLFIGYFILLELGNGYAYDETNILSIFDRAIVSTAHLYNDNGIDPEGILSTIPSVGHVMIGFLAGKIIVGEKAETDKEPLLDSKMIKMFVLGTSLLACGFLLGYACPISKKIWTPTFAMVTCGFASLVLATLIYIVDIKGAKRWSRFFEAFGANPLFLYIMSDIFAILLGCVKISGTSIHGIIYQFLIPAFGETGASCIYAIIFVLFNFAIVAYPLYKRRIYIKI